MALESQGVLIRRASTSLATAASSVLTLATSATVTGGSSRIELLSSNTAVVDFVTNGFTTGMRVKTNSTLSTQVLTISSAAASHIAFYETATADSATTLSATGFTMENIGEVVSFSGPSGAAAVIDITHLRSTAKEKLIGIRDEGNVSLDVLFGTSSTDLHLTLKDDRAARGERRFDIVLTDSGTSINSFYFFDAYVTNFSISGAVDDAIKGSLTLEVTSVVHFTTKI